MTEAKGTIHAVELFVTLCPDLSLATAKNLASFTISQNNYLLLMRKIAILSFFLFFIINNIMAQENSRPSHHLEDGTFTNTTGISNNKSYKEIYNWDSEKKK